MAQERGKIISVQEMWNGEERVVWDSRNGMMYAWEIEMDMGGESVFLKAFSKREDSFALKPGTEVTFETDWNDSKGLPYAKRIKDINSKYNTNNNRPQGRPQGSPRPSSHGSRAQQSRPATNTAAKEPVNYKKVGLGLSIFYLTKVVKQKEINLNSVTIIDMGEKMEEWINEKKNKSDAIACIKMACETMELNEALAVSEETINNSKEMFACAATYYNTLHPEV